jgi:hypothetical protein
MRLTGPRRVTFTLRLQGHRPRRAEITFLGRRLQLRRDGIRWTATYDGNRGVRRPIVRGRVYRMTLLRCGDTCGTELQRARLK